MQPGGKAAFWIVSHFLLAAFKTEFDSFKNCAILSKAIAEKEVLTGPYIGTISQ